MIHQKLVQRRVEDLVLHLEWAAEALGSPLPPDVVEQLSAALDAVELRAALAAVEAAEGAAIREMTPLPTGKAWKRTAQVAD